MDLGSSEHNTEIIAHLHHFYILFIWINECILSQTVRWIWEISTWNLKFRMAKFRILSRLDWFILRLPNCSDEQPAGLMWPATVVSVVHEIVWTHLTYASPSKWWTTFERVGELCTHIFHPVPWHLWAQLHGLTHQKIVIVTTSSLVVLPSFLQF